MLTNQEIPIPLPERFTFASHREFRQSYISQPPEALFVVDFSQTTFIDSAGLGMLLQLAEHSGHDRSRLRFIGMSSSIRAILAVAGFAGQITLT